MGVITYLNRQARTSYLPAIATGMAASLCTGYAAIGLLADKGRITISAEKTNTSWAEGNFWIENRGQSFSQKTITISVDRSEALRAGAFAAVLLTLSIHLYRQRRDSASSLWSRTFKAMGW